mgnify:CR=1 FL=1|jgi:hypothetical protein|nr:MAG TPA: hypothetical protein [Crassvirales sp.]
MAKDKKLDRLIHLSISVSEKAVNIQAAEKLKEDHRRNTENQIKKMLDTEVYYALASKQMRVTVQKMASSLLKVHKLRGRMTVICKISRDLVDKNIMSLDSVLGRKGIEWEAPPMTIRQRKNDQVGGPTHTWIEISKHVPNYGVCTFRVYQNKPISISKNGPRGLSYGEIKDILDFTLQEFDKFEAEFIQRVEKWLSK